MTQHAPVGRTHVRVVDEAGRDGGTMPVAEAHLAGGTLHRAFSVVLHDGRGRVLLQRRADAKLRWPGYVANACCGHPSSLATVIDDASTRLAEELGIVGVTLREVGTFVYRAAMPGDDWVEWEHDHVLVGLYRGEPVVNPAEASATYWVDVARWQERAPSAPWLDGVMRVAAPHLEEEEEEHVDRSVV